MKRTLSVILSLCMLLSCLCFTAATAEGEWLTLRVEVYDRNTAGLNMEDNMQLHYIQEKFGDPNHIKVEFVPVSRWSETEILNRLLAGQTAPDICMTYDQANVQQYIDQGGLYPLNDLLAEYGQNLVKFLGENVLQFGRNNLYNSDGTPQLNEDGSIALTPAEQAEGNPYIGIAYMQYVGGSWYSYNYGYTTLPGVLTPAESGTSSFQGYGAKKISGKAAQAEKALTTSQPVVARRIAAPAVSSTVAKPGHKARTIRTSEREMLVK